MSPSPDLIAFIARWEGCRLEAYQDSEGVWTIGYGHTGKVKPGECISQDRAEELLAADVDEVWHAIDPHIKVTLAQHEMDALTSFAFNVGVGVPGKDDGLVYLKSGKPSTLLTRVNAGDFGAAAAEFPKWNRGIRGGVIVGLTRRRAAERAMFEFAQYLGAP